MSLFHSDDVRIAIVDSSKRISGTSSAFSISIDMPSYTQDFDRVALNQFSCPRSWYDINSTSNTFTLKENTSQATITIPIGMYNVYTLASTLAPLLSSNSPNGLIYSISYPNASQVVNTNKFTFSVNTTSIAVQFIFTSRSPYQQLGFGLNTTNTFTIGSTNSTLVSVNSISISSINRLFLVSNCCGTAQDGILQEILIAGNYPSTSFVYYENLNYDTNSKEFTNPANNSWEFAIYDRYGNIVDLNGLEVVFSLIFYKKNKTDELHFNDIKLKNLEKML